MKHVISAGRTHSLYSRRLFFSSGPFLLLLFYFVLCLGRTDADCSAVENHGGDCDAMIFAAAQAIIWPTRVFYVCSKCLFVLTRLTCGNRGKFHMPWFQLARAPEGRCQQACLYNRVLPAVLISKMTETFILYFLFLRMMKTEDRHSEWFCSSCNEMADNA